MNNRTDPATKAPLKETSLYAPVKTWLERQGYTVRGEVGRCDIAAVKDENLIVVELKLKASMALLAQAAERQDYADAVYIALPVTGKRHRPPDSGNLNRLLRRLDIGLILVVFLKKSVRVEIISHPGEESQGIRRKRPKRRGAILREVAGRDMDLTPGGLAGGKGRVSAYRQRAIRLAAWLSVLREATPADLKGLGAPPDTGAILSRNLYGWFTRLRRGVYGLHPAGEQVLRDVPELAELYVREIAP